MADERKGQRAQGDEVEQDGLGRDAAHGDKSDDTTTGGSYGRSTGRAGDDPTTAPDDAASRARDAEGRRQGLEGRGFDAGTGYGGGGNASAYRSESGFGGQAGARGAQIPRGTDEQSEETETDREGRQLRGVGENDAIDVDDASQGRRRDPLR